MVGLLCVEVCCVRYMNLLIAAWGLQRECVSCQRQVYALSSWSPRLKASGLIPIQAALQLVSSLSQVSTSFKNTFI